MPMQLGPADHAFFRERTRFRTPGVTRSLARARAFAPFLGIPLDDIGIPLLTVVGSKGKGTTAVYASAALAAAGLTTGTLTSPGYRTNRERIRINGAAVDEATFSAIASRLDAALDAAEGRLPEGGYLSPTGLFTMSAVAHFLAMGCDAMVLEAGMGGMSDEVSLFAPDVVAVTSIFAEHLGILGDSVEGIAANKLGVVRDSTRAVVSVAQEFPEVAAQVTAAGAGRERILGAAAPDDPLAGGYPGWPPLLVGRNARLGVLAAHELLRASGRSPADAQTFARVLDTVQLPGRMSLHRRGAQRWIVDAAINETGVRETLRWCEEQVARPATVLVCAPDDKDIAGMLAALGSHRVLQVRVDAGHLHFERQAALPTFAELDPDHLGDVVLAVGTISFAGEILDFLDAPTERAFSAPLAVAVPAGGADRSSA